ncbi:MAG: hypothetical protein KUG69_15210 [Marinosulfonomonas sp.]|nr:hypothetical protein [Marinosulfonomonas sp.]
MTTISLTNHDPDTRRSPLRTSVKHLLAGIAIAVTASTASVIVTDTGPAEAAGAQWFTRVCYHQSGDREMDRQLCRQGFQRDLNNWGGLHVHRCYSSTTVFPTSYFSRAGCYVTW